MKHIRHIWRNKLRPWWYDYEWPIIGCLGVAAMVLGYIGFRLQLKQADEVPLEQVDLLFRSAQLFVLQISVDPPMPWQLNLARILAPLVAGYTAIQAISQLLADQFQSFRLRFLHRHVVICGLGRKGLILASDFLEEKNRVVVVIEQDAENDYIAQCRDMGGIVLIGDATDTRMLQKVCVGRATHLFAFCGDDGENAEIAVRAKELVPENSAHRPICTLHLFNTRLCNLLEVKEMDDKSNDRMTIQFFNTYELGARVMLEEYPLYSPGDDPAASTGRLVIVGVGSLGESLFANAIRQWRASGAASAKRLPITLIDRDAQTIAAKLRVRYPGLEKVCDLDPRDMDVDSADFEQADFLVPDITNGQPARVFVCMDDDSLNLTAALVLATKHHNNKSTIVARMAHDGGLAVLLTEANSSKKGHLPNLRAFGLLDHACTVDQVLRGTDEILARGIHDNYLRQQLAAGVTREINPSVVPWKVLPKEFQESNRKQAADIRSKLETVHCVMAPMQDWGEKLFDFKPEEIDLLARMEHDRWMEEKRQSGWSYAPIRDNPTKKHPCLVSYDELPLEEQEKDISAVEQIPALLAEVGFCVHRIRRRDDADQTKLP
jgi:hypothetical protein